MHTRTTLGGTRLCLGCRSCFGFGAVVKKGTMAFLHNKLCNRLAAVDLYLAGKRRQGMDVRRQKYIYRHIVDPLQRVLLYFGILSVRQYSVRGA